MTNDCHAPPPSITAVVVVKVAADFPPSVVPAAQTNKRLLLYHHYYLTAAAAAFAFLLFHHRCLWMTLFYLVVLLQLFPSNACTRLDVDVSLVQLNSQQKCFLRRPPKTTESINATNSKGRWDDDAILLTPP